MLFKLLSILFFSASSVVSAATFDDLYVDGRARSLGLALTAWVDDYSSLYRNPAGLALHKTVDLNFFNFYGAYTQDVLEAIDSLTAVQGGGDSTPAQQLALLDRLAVGLDARMPSPGLYLKSIAAGIYLADTKIRMRFRTPNPLFAKVNLRATSDFGFAVGYGHAMWDNKLRFGVSFRPLAIRAGFDRSLEGTELVSAFGGGSGITGIFSPETSGIGLGFDADVGMQAELEPFKIYRFGLKPMFGVAFQNIVATDYSISLSEDYQGTPPPNQRKINVGFALRMDGVGKFRPTWSVEYRDILVDVDSIWEHVVTGAEMMMMSRDWFTTALRLHWARGNVGGGVGIHLYWAELEFGTYAENLGKGIGVGVDRRYYAQVSGVF